MTSNLLSVYDRISFLFKAEYSTVCIYHLLFTHSSLDIHLGCFHLWATTNTAAMNTGVQVSESLFLILLDTFRGVELLGHMTTLYLAFWRTTGLFSKVSAPFNISISNGSNFSKSPQTLIFHVSDESYHSRFEELPQCGFNLHFSNDYWCWASFHVLLTVRIPSHGGMSFQELCPFFNELLNCKSSYIFGY